MRCVRRRGIGTLDSSEEDSESDSLPESEVEASDDDSELIEGSRVEELVCESWELSEGLRVFLRARRAEEASLEESEAVEASTFESLRFLQKASAARRPAAVESMTFMIDK